MVAVNNNYGDIEEKWQRRWHEARIFDAEPGVGGKKFFITVPYPYTSGPLHIGHGRTYTKGDTHEHENKIVFSYQILNREAKSYPEEFKMQVAEDRDIYLANGTLYVPEKASWDYIKRSKIQIRW